MDGSRHETIEHHAGQVVGVLQAHPEARERLLPLPLDLLRLERRVAHDVRQQVEADRQAVLHDDHVGEAQVAAGTRAEPPPIESMVSAICSADRVVVP